ncbi:hypothetical protein CICLE_v10024640mg [Citrus x clementina]|uniref:Uncharacterized protein n=1 Tax=Citrus clementina TaxID=85681 RepID=V4TT85_CITCL|nr:hypothetical protein CICLE_v10024640mg [Citrus x clementina]
MISIGAGFDSFLLFGLQHPRIFKISHSNNAVWVNFVGFDFYSCVSGFKGFFFQTFVQFLVSYTVGSIIACEPLVHFCYIYSLLIF